MFKKYRYDDSVLKDTISRQHQAIESLCDELWALKYPENYHVGDKIEYSFRSGCGLSPIKYSGVICEVTVKKNIYTLLFHRQRFDRIYKVYDATEKRTASLDECNILRKIK